MARNTKTSAAGAAPKPGIASQADARAARDATASTAGGSEAKATSQSDASGIEDAVIVSEENASGVQTTGVAAETSTGPNMPSVDAKDEVNGPPKTDAPVGVAAKKSEGDPKVAAKSPDAPAAAATARDAPSPATSRTTIGTGADGADPDPRLGKGDADKGADRKVEPAPARSPAPAASSAAARRGSGFWPLLLGGLVAGAIGYAIPTYLMPRQGAQIDPSRIESLEAGLAALTDQRANDASEVAFLRDAHAAEVSALDDLEARVATLEAAPAASSGQSTPAGPTAAASTASVEGPGPASVADLTAIGARVDDVAARVATVEDDVGDISGQLADLSGRTDALGGDVTAATERVEAVLGDVDATSGRVETLAGDVTSLRDDLGGRIDGVEAGLATATERASSVEDNAEALAREAARNQIRGALQSGAAYDEPLGVLAGEAPAALSDPAAAGIATQAELVADFPALSREALRQARAAEPETGVGSLFRNAFGARSLEPRAGADPDAVLSRAEAAVRGGDLDTALDEVDALPAAAKDVLANWIAEARTRVAARAAADEFLKDG